MIIILILTILTIALAILLIRQNKRINRIEREKKALEISKNSSLEYIDALWSSQKSLIRDEKLSSLNYLVSGIAHELNTPLGISLTSLSYINDQIAVIKSKKLHDDLGPMLQLSMDNLLKSITLVEKFTELSQDEHSDEAKPVQIQNFFDFVCCRIKPYKDYNVVENIKFDLPDSLWINVSQLSLTIILKNIIENAFDFAFKDRTDGIITISAKADESDLILNIKDNGAGITEKDLNHIFDPFYTTHRSQKHYGLGLAISYNLVTRLYNGKLVCLSSKGKGTEFILTIPNIIQ